MCYKMDQTVMGSAGAGYQDVIWVNHATQWYGSLLNSLLIFSLLNHAILYYSTIFIPK